MAQNGLKWGYFGSFDPCERETLVLGQIHGFWPKRGVLGETLRIGICVQELILAYGIHPPPTGGLTGNPL